MYQECITCPKIGISCDGPNFIAMSAPELLAWCKARKAQLHLSNAALADMSGMPKGTIDRLFAGEHMDFRYETVRPLVKALVGGKEWSGNPCDNPSDSEWAELLEKIRHLESELIHRDEKIADLQATNSSMQTLITNTNTRTTVDKDFLRGEMKRKNKTIVILSTFLGLCLLLIIGALVIDRINPEIGFFWLRSWLGGSGSEYLHKFIG